MHALLARELIAACGGLDEAAGACRLKKSRLSECQVPGSGAFLPIDAVCELEAYCGRPLVSQAMVDARPAAAEPGPLADEACGTAEDASDLQRLVRRTLALRHGRLLTPLEARAINQKVLHLQEELFDLLAATDRVAS